MNQIIIKIQHITIFGLELRLDGGFIGLCAYFKKKKKGRWQDREQVGICCVTQELSPVICDNLEGWDGVRDGRWIQERGDIYTHLWLIHVDMWQKSTHYLKQLSFN